MVLPRATVQDEPALGRIRWGPNGRHHCLPRGLSRSAIRLPSSQQRGIGTRLLQIAQRALPRLYLWTFQGNVRARRFYERRGFQLVKETNGAHNEEKEPDALYFWARDQSHGMDTEALADEFRALVTKDLRAQVATIDDDLRALGIDPGAIDEKQAAARRG